MYPVLLNQEIIHKCTSHYIISNRNGQWKSHTKGFVYTLKAVQKTVQHCWFDWSLSNLCKRISNSKNVMNCPWVLLLLYALMSACLHFWCTPQYQPDGKPQWTWGRPSDTPVWSSLRLQSPEMRSRQWVHTKVTEYFNMTTVVPPWRF